MTSLQAKLTEILKWYHKICQENNLVYYVIGGTMLGAVRHKGFIPWDDDIDVGMPRPDYEKFCQLSSALNENGKYRIEYLPEKKDFVYPYCKIYDTETTLIENTRYKTKRGIYIDVFPIDGAGNTLDEGESIFKTINFRLNLLLTRVCAIRKGRSFYKNAAVLICRCVPDFIYSNCKLIEAITRYSKKKDYTSSDYVANFVGNWGKKEIVKKEWMGEPRLYQFENINIYGVSNYDKYLTRLYGDYMKLPPREKRESHHDFISIDLEKSYIDI